MRLKVPLVLRLLALVLTASLSGCAAVRADFAPWDPVRPESLMNQIPNWENEATARCAGRLKPSEVRPGMTNRC